MAADSKFDYVRSLPNPSPAWLYDEKGRATPSAGSDTHSQASSRYGPPPSLDQPSQLKISTPMPQRPRKASIGHSHHTSLVLSRKLPNSPLSTPTPSVKEPSKEDRLQGILEDETAKHTKLGSRWLNSLDSVPPSRWRAKIRETIPETGIARQSFMTATSASVYSYHGPEPVGVAYGGEEYEL